MRPPLSVRWGRLVRTLWHLSPGQLAWRIRYLALRRMEGTHWWHMQEAAMRRAIGPIPGALRPLPAELPVLHPSQWHQPVRVDLENGTVDILGARFDVHDWERVRNPGQHRLQSSHFQSHDWLLDVPSVDAIGRIMLEWVEDVAPGSRGFAQLGWNGYVIATRLYTWARLFPRLSLDESARGRLIESFGLQAEYLSRHIEHDLQGNHLVRDALGLGVAAAAWVGPASTRWRKKAAQLARAALRQQVLSDGGHYERSPMYHIQVMDDLSVLATLFHRTEMAAAISETLLRMARWLDWMTHPDGEIALFHDGALGVEAAPHAILEQVQGEPPVSVQPRGAQLLDASGYAVMHADPWSVFVDVGGLGPREQPGHAHASNLALECSYGGKRLLVDAGASGYDADASRARDRSTARHNAVCVDNLDSSELWHIFRVGRRARSRLIQYHGGQTEFSVIAEHDGYRRVGVRYIREVRVNGDEFMVKDRIEAAATHRLTCLWMVAPGWVIHVVDDGYVLCGHGSELQVSVRSTESVRCGVIETMWHPRYGASVATVGLQWTVTAASLEVSMGIAPRSS